MLALAACVRATPSPASGSFEPPLYEGEPVFTVLDASLEGGTLEVVMDHDREKQPEWFDEPVLLAGPERVKGEVLGGSSPHTVVFEGVSQDVREAVVEFPKVTVQINEATTQPASATIIRGPEGESLEITNRETEARNGTFIIHYEPPTQYGPYVAEAAICAGDRKVSNSGSDMLFSPDPQRIGGSIVFPPKAMVLAEAEGAVLEVASFRKAFRVRVPVSLGP